jgi:hypothetical protein
MQAAVGSKSSSSGPLCDVGEGGSNCSTAVPGSGRNSEDVDVVAATTVDELLAMHKLNRVDLLKVGGTRSRFNCIRIISHVLLYQHEKHP